MVQQRQLFQSHLTFGLTADHTDWYHGLLLNDRKLNTTVYYIHTSKNLPTHVYGDTVCQQDIYNTILHYNIHLHCNCMHTEHQLLYWRVCKYCRVVFHLNIVFHRSPIYWHYNTLGLFAAGKQAVLTRSAVSYRLNFKGLLLYVCQW